MKLFLSSTFLDLAEERKAVLGALDRKRASTLAMETFLATPATPLDTSLANLRNSDLMILVIGFRAGSLLPEGSSSTYTSAEYDEALRLGKDVLVFVKYAGETEHNSSWRNDEQTPERRDALDAFKKQACERWTTDHFATPKDLALNVILAIDQWEASGRPGARSTFSSTVEYFAGKNPVGHFRILDFGITLLGREKEIRALNNFAADARQRVCILSGRGGIGKSKILHDWANMRPAEVVFLKDEPLWHEDSYKEIPNTCKTVIVDDAHRQHNFGRVLQLLQDTATRRNLKLIVSTRPGSSSLLSQQILRHVDVSQLTQLPELQELSKKESTALAEQVLGSEFTSYAVHLAEIASNSPLVIVAGGCLIASHKINPSTLTTLDEFRSTVFDRLLDEMDLRGPKFLVDPHPVLQLLAALGPVDVERHDFRESAQALLAKPIDEVLATIDALGENGIVTARPKPVRVLPDVLSDYILEKRCIPGNLPTGYADRVYEHFGAHSLKSLMHNLAELDWRRGQAGETGLNLLNGIWTDIHRRFRAGDEYQRYQILTDLAGAAIYQPDQIIALVRTAISDPIYVDPASDNSQYRAGQDYVLSAVPSLLEATAYHPERLSESVTTLWELTKRDSRRASVAESSKTILKRLASWHRFGDAAQNFAMLVQAIRLARRDDAFTSDFTPFTLIEQILEREGEFTEWQDEMTMSFGGFGLNYGAVEPVRRSALDYLDFVLEGDDVRAIYAVPLLENLLPNFLNRVGRVSTEEEIAWQSRERVRCLRAILRRHGQPASPLLKARLYSAIRSATGINYPDPIREAATAALSDIVEDDAAAVVDAICTADYDLPFVSAEFTEASWERPITELMNKGRTSLERITAGAGNQAHFTIDQTRACIELRLKTGGFHRFMLSFADRQDFLTEMAEQLVAHPQIGEMITQLSSVLDSIHRADPAAFRERAHSALQSGAVHVIHASASNLRVFEGATEEDIALIQEYAGYPDPIAKRGAIFAITYMGKFTELGSSLKEAVLSIKTEGDQSVASDLADSFGPYGVPLTSLTRDEADALASEFEFVQNWDFDQGSIPRFLNRFVNLFPDETYHLLLRRIERNTRVKQEFRSFRLAHENISFGGIPAEKRLELGEDCIHRVLRSESADEFASLFWAVAGYDAPALQVILNASSDIDDRGVENLAMLIDRAIPRLAFTDRDFVSDLLARVKPHQRKRIVEAFAFQARKFEGGVYAGDVDDHLSAQNRQYSEAVSAFSDEPGLEDLGRELRRFT